MTDIKHDFEYNSLKLSICIIDSYHNNLWNEVLGIVETYGRKSQREIKQVYAVFNKDYELLDRNEDILYGFRHKLNINITELEKKMYYVVDKEYLYSYPELELPILRDEYAYNYLIIEMIDDKYIIGRYGVNDVESYDFNNPQFYGYDEQTEFCNFDALPIEFKKPIEELKQKLKMIDDASTIGKVQKWGPSIRHILKEIISHEKNDDEYNIVQNDKITIKEPKIKMTDNASTIVKLQNDDYIPDPQEDSREAWEYMNTPEYKRQIKIQQKQYLQSDEYNIVQNNKIVTDIRKPTNVFKQIDIKNPDITITATKNNVVNNVVKPEYKNSKINSEQEQYNSFPLGKITKLEKDLNDLQNKFKESVKLTENCMKSIIDDSIIEKVIINGKVDGLQSWIEALCQEIQDFKNEKEFMDTQNLSHEKIDVNSIYINTFDDEYAEVSLTTTKLRQFSGIIGLEYTIEDEDGNLITKLWSYEEVKELVKKWIRQRMVDKKTNLCVLLSNVETLMYCYEKNVVEEPSIRVYGEIVRPNADIPDGEIKKILLELFTYLREELKQYNVRFNFQGYHENISIRIS